MARYQDFNKEENAKKKQKKQKEKEQRKEERKSSSGKKSFEDMIAYVDAYGNIVDTPPDPNEKEEVNIEDIAIGVPRKSDVRDESDSEHKGTVTFFNDSKGFGFIKSENGTSVFVHINNLQDKIRENDKVVFEVEQGPKGFNALNVRLVKK